MRPPAFVLMLALWLVPEMASAQSVVTSPAADTVEVSLYRDDGRAADEKIDREYPEGFALISETRIVTLPAGPATIRFEGVASGINPASALVRGIGIAEKNQDANLLSQRGLLDHFTGQRVTIRRFNAATGETIEETATIRSGADRLIIQTSAGFEPVYCTGLDQTLVFDRKPEDLSAKPTLSVNVGDQPGGEYRLTLTYLAEGFDWQANYVAEMNDDGSRIDLIGWMTMVSADATSFTDARANAIAGTVFRDEDYENTLYADGQEEIGYNCWPAGNTGRFAGYQSRQRPFAVRARSLSAPQALQRVAGVSISEADLDDGRIIVTGTRKATREDLGDLKLYRIPFATTVAANSQKQVAFLDKRDVKGEIIYKIEVEREDIEDSERIFRMQNEEEDGLGEPLPSGQFAFFQHILGLRQLVGEDGMDDKAVGEEIELTLGGTDNLTASIDDDDQPFGKNWGQLRITLRNANRVPVTVETEFLPDDYSDYRRFSKRTFERDGKKVWRTTVPANGEKSLTYRVYDTD